MAAISSRAAASGAAAEQMALITATPSAPAAMTSATLPALMPPMPMTGTLTAALTSAKRAGEAGRVPSLAVVPKMSPTAT
jgi:hypothetical protein